LSRSVTWCGVWKGGGWLLGDERAMESGLGVKQGRQTAEQLRIYHAVRQHIQ